MRRTLLRNPLQCLQPSGTITRTTSQPFRRGNGLILGSEKSVFGCQGLGAGFLPSFGPAGQEKVQGHTADTHKPDSLDGEISRREIHAPDGENNPGQYAGQFRCEFTKILGADIMFAHEAQFVANERMVHNMDGHGQLLSPLRNMGLQP